MSWIHKSDTHLFIVMVFTFCLRNEDPKDQNPTQSHCYYDRSLPWAAQAEDSWQLTKAVPGWYSGLGSADSEGTVSI